MEGRTAFKFYKSYYDVAKELDDKDRLAFYDAIMSKQFFNKDVELLGNSRFAYISQKHSIDRQVKGYMDRLGITDNQQITNPIQPPLAPPSQGPTQPPYVDPSQQEKEKEEEKEKGRGIDFTSLLSFINKKTGRKFKVINDKTKNKYKARLKEGYTKEDISTAITNASKTDYHLSSKCQYLTPEFFSRSETIDKYGTTKDQGNPENANKKNEVPKQHGIWSV